MPIKDGEEKSTIAIIIKALPRNRLEYIEQLFKNDSVKQVVPSSFSGGKAKEIAWIKQDIKNFMCKENCIFFMLVICISNIMKDYQRNNTNKTKEISHD